MNGIVLSRRLFLATLLILLCSLSAQATIYFHDTFSTLDGWVTSEADPTYGKIQLVEGAQLPNHKDEGGGGGLSLVDHNTYYAVSKKLPTPISNDGKSLVISFAVVHPNALRYGGAYFTFLTDLDQKKFKPTSKYWLMFGPDTNGTYRITKAVLNYKGTNFEWKEAPPALTDIFVHWYTLHWMPNNTYSLYLDGVKTDEGPIEEEWGLLEPKMIDDPSDVKPADWVDEAEIVDPDDKEPADWNDEPVYIPDPFAEKPLDWDEKKQGGPWKAPMVYNRNHRPPWTPGTILNPAYKGEWKPRQIPNPAYVPDKNLYRAPEPITHVGLNVLHGRAESTFQCLMIGDDIDEVLAHIHAGTKPNK